MDLNLRGSVVNRVCFDTACTLLVTEGCQLRIETRAALHLVSGEQVSFDPESPAVAAARLVGLIGDVISCAVVVGDGDLLIEFDSGVKLAVRSDDAYEAWELSGLSGRRMICMPGGEIALWSAEDLGAI